MNYLEEIGNFLIKHAADPIKIEYEDVEYEFTLAQCFTMEHGYTPFDRDYYWMSMKELEDLDESEVKEWLNMLQKAVETGRWGEV